MQDTTQIQDLFKCKQLEFHLVEMRSEIGLQTGSAAVNVITCTKYLKL